MQPLQKVTGTYKRGSRRGLKGELLPGCVDMINIVQVLESTPSIATLQQHYHSCGTFEIEIVLFSSKEISSFVALFMRSTGSIKLVI